MQNIACYPFEGGVAYTIPGPDFSIEDVISFIIPVNTPYVLTNSDQLPTSEFRDAWVFHETNGAVVDIERAKEIHRDRIRTARVEAFKNADRDFMFALETNDEIARLDAVARKVALRDLPGAIEITSAQNVQDLRDFWPTSLLGPTPYKTV